jgi:hypothetical protein
MTGTHDSLTANILQLVATGKVRQKILTTLIPLFFSLPFRINFSQMAKACPYNESTLHRWFEKDLSLPQFNFDLIEQYASENRVAIFDPSFLTKSGKKTFGVDYFWSGQAQEVKKGNEMGSFAIGDLDNHIAFHLHAELTPTHKDLEKDGLNLVSHYVNLVKNRKEDIMKLGKGILVADGYFGVETFVSPVTEMGIEIVSCFRINLLFHYLPPIVEGKRGPGRPNKYGDRIDMSSIDDKMLPIVYDDAEKTMRFGTIWVKCLAKFVRILITDYKNTEGSVKVRKLYFCTNLKRDWKFIAECYGIRFQIEFIFRDGKQFLGLNHCQSKDKVKFENHLNLSLTCRNVAIVSHWLQIPEAQRPPFSMAQIKQSYVKAKMIEVFSEALGLDPIAIKNNPKIQSLVFPKEFWQNVA